ncbi:hypothetical protein TK1348 [Thermococcus kodakarensis KOD1]|uniref:Uncharacterized protein n=1 Tax=Thermococcus kodakarensis (strain ATCC BAA-918 / JCM 12380 / KOD1) TaxID=69014 RepID=Q5JGU0_THEKO|nr:hypothetical protein [Thermococcus kodakarensis]WCN27327.1 hypothetical protein POG15_06850 [Thermococcus kodakarensis]WCN29616.1 hypothetical protein POG21_06845 [Thermococcus kodakarensis]BAD85537.1 hypothetical protein TK1348 [Thermococcus kodakarensis KOD1]
MVFAKPGIIRLDPREKYGFEPDDLVIRPFKPGIPLDKMRLISKLREQRAKQDKTKPTPMLNPISKPKSESLPKPQPKQDSGQVEGVNLIDFEMTALPGAGGGAKKTEHETKRVGGYKLIVPKKPEEKEIKRIENATKTQPDTDGLLKFVRMVGILAVVIVLIGLFIGGRKK